jgi:hypothetical protein
MTVRMLAAMAVAIAASFSLPAAVGAQADPPAEPPGTGGEPPPEEPPEEPSPEAARLSVRVKGLEGASRPALKRATAVGRLAPFVPGQRVRVRFQRVGKTIKHRTVRVRRAPRADHGVFMLRSPRLTEPGRYRVKALKPATAAQAGARARGRQFKLRFPGLREGDRGRAVGTLNKLLRKRGYHAPGGRRFTSATARAVLAFRKVNLMSRSQRATPGILERLVRGKGEFKLRHRGAGRHVEVDVDRQVMVLAAKGKPQHTFHISSGHPNTPSDRGRFRFYRRQPGYNHLRMYFSVYYNGGEAIHGYDSVPNYPASHGCVRSPIPDARFIYGWVRIGMPIFVY